MKKTIGLLLLLALLLVPGHSYGQTILSAPNGAQTVTGLDDDVAVATTGSKYLKLGVLQQYTVGKNIIPIGRYSGDLDAAVAALDVAGNAGEDFVIVIDQATSMSEAVDLSSLSNAASITLTFLSPAGVITTGGNTLTLAQQIPLSVNWQIFDASSGDVVFTTTTSPSCALAEWWWSGSGDIGPATACALAAANRVEIVTNSIAWDTGITLSTTSKNLWVRSRVVTVGLADGEALITINGGSKSKVRFDGIVTCSNANDADFMVWNNGIQLDVDIQQINSFRYGFWFNQLSEGTSFTENIIKYNLIYKCLKGVYLSSAPDGQTISPAEGIQLLGGFISGETLADSIGVHKESNTNGKYWYITGTLDYSIEDYKDESDAGSSILAVKYIDQNSCTFGKSDILIHGRTGTIQTFSNSTTYPSFYAKNTAAPAQVITGNRSLAYFMGPTDYTNTKQQITVGTSPAVDTTSANLANLYSDIGSGYTSSAKKIGLQQVARSNSGTTGVALGRMEIAKNPDTNTADVHFYSVGSTKIGTLSSRYSGSLLLAGSTVQLGAARTIASASADGNTGEICWDADYIYVCTTGTKARGTITLTGVPVEDETFVVRGITYTWKATPSANTHVLIGADAAACCTNIATTINDRDSDVIATKSGNTVLIDYYLGGATGNAQTFTESCTNMTVDGAGTLGATTAGASVWKRVAIATW